MQFEYDPEVLIEVIRKRPGIWDYECPEYREKRTRMHLWNEVVQELMTEEANMTKGELRELELQLQKKWKSLRDCFQKYVSNPTKSKRPYIYSRQMQFLLKDNKLPKRPRPLTVKNGNESGEEEEEEQKPKWKPKKKLKLSKHDEITDEEDVFDNQDNDSDFSPNIKATTSSKGANNDSTQGQFAFANVDAFLKDNNDDPDKMFLMSLLPHLKSIPEEFRLNAKMELMQVLQQANYSISKLI